ncbi:hypothetical protein RSAG8_07217, partial [Rhizoctonia solani AG-8 WAC10335]
MRMLQTLTMSLYHESDDDATFEDFASPVPIDSFMLMHSRRLRKHATIVVLLIALAYLAKKQKVAARRSRRHYLKRAELMPAPHTESPWQSIYQSQEDRALITTMGVDVTTFEFILDHGFHTAWNTYTIPWGDVNPEGLTRLGRRSLDAEGALRLFLHYLSGTMGETNLQQVFALVPSVVSRYIKFAMGIMLALLRRLPDGRITWPTAEKMQEYSDVINKHHPAITGAFGFLDGLSLLPHIMDGCMHIRLVIFLSLHQMVKLPVGTIIVAKINAPGSWHDSRVATHIYRNLIE